MHKVNVLIDPADSMIARFAKHLYKKTENGSVMSLSQCGRFMESFRTGRIEEHMVRSMVSQARAYCEANLNCTIWNIRKVENDEGGYRIATAKEKAIYYGKAMSKTLSWADRTMRLQAIVNREDIPYAIKEVTRLAENALKPALRITPTFKEQMLNYFEKEREKAEKELKLIEAKG